MNYTKGPWKIKKYSKQSLVIYKILEDNAFDEAQICKLTNFILASNDEYHLSEHAKFNNDELMQANAKLISKAPEMYEALKAMVTISDVYPSMKTNKYFKELESLLKEIEK